MDATTEAGKIKRMKLGLVGSSIENNKATLYYKIPDEYLSDVKPFEDGLRTRLSDTIGGNGISISNYKSEYMEKTVLAVTLTEQSLRNFREFERTSMIAEQEPQR